MVIVSFPVELIEISASYNENVNKESMGLTNILIKGKIWKELDKVITKQLKIILKVTLKKVSSKDINTRLGTTNYKTEFIGKIRKQC
jgi:hypothetical protein